MFYYFFQSQIIETEEEVDLSINPAFTQLTEGQAYLYENYEGLELYQIREYKGAASDQECDEYIASITPTLQSAKDEAKTVLAETLAQRKNVLSNIPSLLEGTVYNAYLIKRLLKTPVSELDTNLLIDFEDNLRSEIDKKSIKFISSIDKAKTVDEVKTIMSQAYKEIADFTGQPTTELGTQIKDKLKQAETYYLNNLYFVVSNSNYWLSEDYRHSLFTKATLLYTANERAILYVYLNTTVKKSISANTLVTNVLPALEQFANTMETNFISIKDAINAAKSKSDLDNIDITAGYISQLDLSTYFP